MTARSRAETIAELIELETAYWFEVDHNSGRNAHEMYVEDGLFVIDDTRMEGKDAVRAFYQWRANRGARTARHLITNFHLLKYESDRASLTCIMSLHAADGLPVLESLPAIMIADVLGDCIRGADGTWRFASHVLTSVFRGGAKPTIPGKM